MGPFTVPQSLSLPVPHGLSTHCPLASAQLALGPLGLSAQGISQEGLPWPHLWGPMAEVPAITPTPRNEPTPQEVLIA